MGILFINIVNMYQDSMGNIDVHIITDACINIIISCIMSPKTSNIVNKS